MSTHWQPTLQGPRLRLRPLRREDYEAVYLAASDPKIWEVHPDPLRYTRERFQAFFDSGIECGGALVIEDAGKIIGSSRYTDASDNWEILAWDWGSNPPRPGGDRRP